MKCEYCGTERKSYLAGTCHKCGAPTKRVYGLLRGQPVYADTIEQARKSPDYIEFVGHRITA